MCGPNSYTLQGPFPTSADWRVAYASRSRTTTPIWKIESSEIRAGSAIRRVYPGDGRYRAPVRILVARCEIAYHGRATFDTFTHRKSVLTRPTRLDPSIAYPPYTPLKAKLLRKLL